MRPIFYFLIISIIAITSCKTKNDKISLVGNWYQISFKEGYAEFEFHKDYVIVFSHHIGYSRINYKIKDDSLIYPDIKYAAKIIEHSDSSASFSTYKMVSTLIKWDESVAPFESVPGPIKNKDDSAKYKAYIDNFNKRAKEAYVKAGIFLQENSASASE